MRPRLQDDVRYVPYSQGAYLHSDRGSCVVPGPQAYAWLERLVPYLTGTHQLDELTAALPVDKRTTVRELVELLHRHGLVTDARNDHPHSLTGAERRDYADEIAFIRYALDSAEHRFQRYREARVLILGDGPVLASVLRAGLTSGWRHVRVLPVNRSEMSGLREVAENARRDARQEVSMDAETFDVALADAEVVLHVCGTGEQTRLLEVAEQCARNGTLLGQVLVNGDEAWFGPVERSASASAWRRLRESAVTVPEVEESLLHGPAPVMLGHRLVLAHFRHSTGLDELPQDSDQSDAAGLVRIDLHTMESERHGFLPHPGRCSSRPRSQEEARAAFDVLTEGEPVTREELLSRSATAVDARTGLFSSVDEEDFTQFPQWVCRARLSDPFGLLPAGAPLPEVVGYGLERDESRTDTVLAACAGYGALAVDHRRLVPLRCGTGEWGLDLVDGNVRLVPSDLVFPVLRTRRTPWDAPTGAAAGLSWNAALWDGLRRHCEDLLEQRLAEVDEPLPRLDVSGLPLDGRAAHLGRLLGETGESVVAHDATGLLSVPACALRVGADTVLVVGSTCPEALGRALERGLLAWQARTESQPAYAPHSIPAISVERDTPVGASEAEEPAGVMRLVRALHAVGRTPVAVALDHDPEIVRILPYLVQVVLVDE